MDSGVLEQLRGAIHELNIGNTTNAAAATEVVQGVLNDPLGFDYFTDIAGSDPNSNARHLAIMMASKIIKVIQNSQEDEIVIDCRNRMIELMKSESEQNNRICYAEILGNLWTQTDGFGDLIQFTAELFNKPILLASGLCLLVNMANRQLDTVLELSLEKLPLLGELVFNSDSEIRYQALQTLNSFMFFNELIDQINELEWLPETSINLITGLISNNCQPREIKVALEILNQGIEMYESFTPISLEILTTLSQILDNHNVPAMTRATISEGILTIIEKNMDLEVDLNELVPPFMALSVELLNELPESNNYEVILDFIISLKKTRLLSDVFETLYATAVELMNAESIQEICIALLTIRGLCDCAPMECSEQAEDIASYAVAAISSEEELLIDFGARLVQVMASKIRDAASPHLDAIAAALMERLEFAVCLDALALLYRDSEVVSGAAPGYIETIISAIGEAGSDVIDRLLAVVNAMTGVLPPGCTDVYEAISSVIGECLQNGDSAITSIALETFGELIGNAPSAAAPNNETILSFILSLNGEEEHEPFVYQAGASCIQSMAEVFPQVIQEHLSETVQFIIDVLNKKKLPEMGERTVKDEEEEEEEEEDGGDGEEEEESDERTDLAEMTATVIGALCSICCAFPTELQEYFDTAIENIDILTQYRLPEVTNSACMSAVSLARAYNKGGYDGDAVFSRVVNAIPLATTPKLAAMVWEALEKILRIFGVVLAEKEAGIIESYALQQSGITADDFAPELYKPVSDTLVTLIGILKEGGGCYAEPFVEAFVEYAGEENEAELRANAAHFLAAAAKSTGSEEIAGAAAVAALSTFETRYPSVGIPALNALSILASFAPAMLEENRDAILQTATSIFAHATSPDLTDAALDLFFALIIAFEMNVDDTDSANALAVLSCPPNSPYLVNAATFVCRLQSTNPATFEVRAPKIAALVLASGDEVIRELPEGVYEVLAGVAAAQSEEALNELLSYNQSYIAAVIVRLNANQ